MDDDFRKGGHVPGRKGRNTSAAYQSRWTIFECWCARAGQCACPASTSTLRLFIAWLLEVHRARLGTAKLTLAAIVDQHRRRGYQSPRTPALRQFLVKCTRSVKEGSGAKAPLTVEQIELLCSLPCETAVALRDRAIILLGFACGCRRSELVGLDLEDVLFDERGVLLRLRCSKTDRETCSRTLRVAFGGTPESCPVTALRNWIAARGPMAGPIFQRTISGCLCNEPMSGQAVCRLLKRLLLRAGIDPRPYGAHSLRLGALSNCG